MAEKQKTFSLLPKILNGGIAGFIGVCCVFPLDLVKTRIQNQVVAPDGTRMYTSIKDALVKTVRKEGFFGMYKGSLINLALIFPEKAIKLASNDFFRFHLKKADNSLPMYRQVMAGAGSALIQIVPTPMELIKIQMQDQGRLAAAAKTGAGPNTLQVIKQIFKENGITGFYKGLGATMLRDGLFGMIYFPLFANINNLCPLRKDGDAVAWCTFAAGLFAGGTAAISVTPCDVVKTRLQTIKKGKGEEYYSSIPDAFKSLPKVLNGVLAGFIGVLSFFPLDLVKTRMQNQVVAPDGTKTYSSIFDALVKTLKKDGFFGMYKGFFVNLLLILPEKAIKLASNDFFRFHLKLSDGSLPMHRQLAAGAGAAVCQMFITTPMELLKIQMQDQGRIAAGGKGASTFEVAARILRQDGIGGFYKGSAATLLRDIPFSMIYFPLFTNLNLQCPIQSDHNALDAVAWCTFGAGMGAGATAAITVTPCDVVKTRLQTIRKGRGEEYYSGIRDAFIKIWNREGWKAFFKGGACRIMVAAPMFGVTQVAYYLGIAEYILGLEKHT